MHMQYVTNFKYSKTCVKRPLKNRQNKIMNGRLMKVESIAECSKGSILQYFCPALSDNWSLNQFSVFLRVAILHKFYCTGQKQHILYQEMLN